MGFTTLLFSAVFSRQQNKAGIAPWREACCVTWTTKFNPSWQPWKFWKSLLDLQVNAHSIYCSYLISLLELVLSVDFLSTIVDSLASCCWSSMTSWLFCRTRSLFISSSRLCDSGISPVMSYINIIINIIVMGLFIYWAADTLQYYCQITGCYHSIG